MPRKSPHPSVADEHAAPGGAAAVDRAISLLAAFQPGDAALSLTELAQRTRLYKSTVLRLLASLAQGGLVRRTPEGHWALGPLVPRLAAVHAASFSLEAIVLPPMRELVARTQESASFHVRQGDQRLVLARVDSPQLLRDHVRTGELLPLERGAGGRVLLAFAGAPGAPYDEVRRDGVVTLVGDRVAGLAGISAPVWQAPDRLAGALTLTLPDTRLQPGFADEVRRTAAQISEALGGRPPSA